MSRGSWPQLRLGSSSTIIYEGFYYILGGWWSAGFLDRLKSNHIILPLGGSKTASLTLKSRHLGWGLIFYISFYIIRIHLGISKSSWKMSFHTLESSCTRYTAVQKAEDTHQLWQSFFVYIHNVFLNHSTMWLKQFESANGQDFL